MNKLKTALIASALITSPLAAATPSIAADTNCQQIGETVYKGDPRYLAKLDKDADGRICEAHKIQLPANGTPLPDGAVNPGTYGPANGGTTGQVDANGNPVQLDSNGNPISKDSAASQQKNLANTGANGIIIWSIIGGLALIAGLFLLRRAKTQ